MPSHFRPLILLEKAKGLSEFKGRDPTLAWNTSMPRWQSKIALYRGSVRGSDPKRVAAQSLLLRQTIQTVPDAVFKGLFHNH